jgi:hypothetical protein
VEEILIKNGFEKKELTEDQSNLVGFFQLPIYKDIELPLNASVSAAPDVNKIVYLIDFEVTCAIMDQEIHCGSYDMIINENNLVYTNLVVKQIVLFLIQAAKLYRATQMIIDVKRKAKLN